MKASTRNSLTSLILLLQRLIVPFGVAAAAAGLFDFAIVDRWFPDLKARLGSWSVLPSLPVFVGVYFLVRSVSRRWGNRLLQKLWRDHEHERPVGLSGLVQKPDSKKSQE